MAKAPDATGGERRGGTHQQRAYPKEGHAAVVAPTPAVARKPAGQGTDPTRQDQQDSRETRADPALDKGEADRRFRR